MTVLKGFMLWGLVVLVGCQGGGEAPLSEGERALLTVRIDSLTTAFEAAERSQNAERTIAFLAPDFYMYVDGVRSGYDSVAASIRRTLGGMQHFEPGFDAVEVRVLSREAAFTSFTFRDSIVTASGETMQFRGPTTLIWEKRAGRWQIVYADADHYTP